MSIYRNIVNSRENSESYTARIFEIFIVLPPSGIRELENLPVLPCFEDIHQRSSVPKPSVDHSVTHIITSENNLSFMLLF